MINLNLTSPLIAALILAILILSFGWLRSCESAKEIVQDNNDAEWRTIVNGLKQDTTDLRAKLRQKAIVTTHDSTAHAKVIRAKDITIVRLRASSAVHRPDVQIYLDSIPKLQAFVDVQDSIILELTDVNAELNASYKAQVRGLNEQLEIHSQIQAKNDEIMKAYEERIAAMMKQARKSERRKKFWRGGALVAGAVLTYELIKDSLE